MKSRYERTALADDYNSALTELSQRIRPLNRARVTGRQKPVSGAPVAAPTPAPTAEPPAPIGSLEEARLAALPANERQAIINRRLADTQAKAAEQAARSSQQNAKRNAARNSTAKNLGYRNSKNQQEDNDQFVELQRRIADPATNVATLEALRDIIVAKGKRFKNTLLVKRYDDLEQRIRPIIDEKRRDEKADAFQATQEKKKANVVARPRTQGVNFVNPLVSKGPIKRTPVNPYSDIAGLTADINAPVPDSPAALARRLGATRYDPVAKARAEQARAAAAAAEARAEEERAAAEEQAVRNREAHTGALQRNLAQQLSSASPPLTRFNVRVPKEEPPLPIPTPSRYSAAVKPSATRTFAGGPIPQVPIRNAVRAVAPNVVPQGGGSRVSRKQRRNGRGTHKKGKGKHSV